MFQGLSWDYGVITHTEIDSDGFLRVQHDAYGEEGGEHYPIFQPFGRIARPRSPLADANGTAKQGSACVALIAKDGSDGYAILGSDPRFVPNVPLPSEGSVGDYCVTDDGRFPFTILSGKDGTYQVYIPTPSGSSIELTIGFEASNGEPKISMVHPDGMGLSMYKGAFSMLGPGGAHSIVIRESHGELNGIWKMNGAFLPSKVIAGTSPVLLAIDPKTLTPSFSTTLFG